METDPDTTSPSATPSSFTHFTQLPYELRLKIWGYILHQPRLIKIIASQRHWRNPYASSGWRTPYASSGQTTHNTPIPIALHVCHESREEALKSYQLAFGSPFCKSKIYIDFSIDTIRFGNGPGIEDTQQLGVWTDPCDYALDVFLGGGAHGADDSEKVERMILDFAPSIYARRNFCWDEIRLFTGLKELTLLVWEPDYFMSQMISQYLSTLGKAMRAHPEWVVPTIRVIGMLSGYHWGLLDVPAVRVDEETDV